MDRKHFDYFAKHESKQLPHQKQQITYTYNNDERTIIGVIEEIGDFIYLYEYRGKYVGTEFFISFSKASISYKLIRVNDLAK